MLAKKRFVATLAVAALTAGLMATTAMTPVDAWAKPAAKAVTAKPVAAKSITDSVRDPAKPVDFAQNHSDLKADPNVIFGRLPNGLTYAILKNATPPGNVSLRLRVGGGSMME
ncbi:MAG: hypothetical protein ACXU8O_03680, partial [Asticcacaulis sp.]